MRYVFLIYASEADYAKMSKEEQDAGFQGHYALSSELQQKKTYQGGAPLQSISTATTVRSRNGKTLTTDGPFAETKEQLTGFYIVECKDLDEAIAVAGKIPEVK